MAYWKKIAGIIAGVALYFSGATTTGFAQNICSEAIVYFESGEAGLNPEARTKLDSLLHQWRRREVLLELEGHTDSDNDLEYNQVLSERRVAAVKHYLQSRGNAKLTVREFGRSEKKPIASNATETGKARNRRVVIKYASLEEGSLKVGATKNAEVSFDVQGLGDCSVCSSMMKAKYYENDQVIASSGWGMTTTGGQNLTSGGMMSFSSGCKDKDKKPFPACFEFPVSSREPEFKGWITNAQGKWEEVPMSIEGNVAKICIPDYTWGRGVNYDCPVVPEYVFADSSNLKVIRSTLKREIARNEPITYVPHQVYNSDGIAKAVYKSLALDEDSVLWVCNTPLTSLAGTVPKVPICKPFHPYTARLAHYRPIVFSDTLQLLKIPAKYEIVYMEYYVKDADTAFAFQPGGKRKFESPILLYDHVLRFKTAKGKSYPLNPKFIRLKYKKRKGKMVGKVKKF
jgi:hypothetical protein